MNSSSNRTFSPCKSKEEGGVSVIFFVFYFKKASSFSPFALHC